MSTLDLAVAFSNQVTSTLSNEIKDSFSFNGTALQTIPEDVQKLASQIVFLDLSKNRINALPLCLAQFSVLTALKLRGNVLVNIPEGIFSGMVALQELDLVDNELEALPSDLGSVTTLERLALTGNNLVTLPDSLMGLSKLRELLLGENKLVELPENIDALKKIEKLEAQENNLTRLPQNLTLCSTLRSLSVHENQLTTLPEKMWLLERLGALHLHENPLDEKLVPPKLFFKRAKAILSYFLAVSEGRADDAAEILEYSVNVPVKQKSASRLAGPKSPVLDSRPQLIRQASTNKYPASPRPDSIGSEIPTGIVNRASMSLRRASTIFDSKDEKAIIAPRPRPAKPSVLARAPTQVTEADAASSPGVRPRPQSIVIPSNPGTLRQSSPKAPPKVPAKPRVETDAPKPTISMPTTPTPELAPNTASPAMTPKNVEDGIDDKLPETPKISNDAHDQVDSQQRNQTVDDKNVAIPTTPGTHTDEPSVEPVEPVEPVTATNPTSDATDVFVEAVTTPTPSARTIESEPNSGPPTERLAVDDAKPLLVRENSVPGANGAMFVFDAAPTPTDNAQAQASPPKTISDDKPTLDASAQNVSDNATAAAIAAPDVEPTASPPDVPSKKPSKKPKVAQEIIDTAEAPAPNSIQTRERAKTRKIVGGDTAIGTPFYSTSDMAYLPRKLVNIPLMRLTSKRYIMGAHTASLPTWKEMFSADNMALMPNGSYQGYNQYFCNEDHVNFAGEDTVDGGFVIVSLLKKATSETDVNCIIRTKDGDSALLIPVPDKKPKDANGWLALLKKNSDFSAVVPKQVKLAPVVDASFPTELMDVETKLNRVNCKFGVVYCKEGQTEEEEFLSNEEGSPEFNEFLEWLGDRVPLQGWTKYDGGLDTQKNATGTHSVYAEWKQLNVMFHVSTLLPLTPEAKPSDADEEEDEEQDSRTQEKKVHIGNDIVVIVFLEGEGVETSFNPRKFVSHFNHVFIVVNPVRQKGMTLYRINTIYKSDVQPCLPDIPSDAIFEKSDEFRELFFTKLVNSERSACLTQQFASSLASLRYHTLYNAGKKYQTKASGGCFAACAGKK